MLFGLGPFEILLVVVVVGVLLMIVKRIVSGPR